MVTSDDAAYHSLCGIHHQKYRIGRSNAARIGCCFIIQYKYIPICTPFIAYVMSFCTCRIQTCVVYEYILKIDLLFRIMHFPECRVNLNYAFKMPHNICICTKYEKEHVSQIYAVHCT